MECFYCIDPPRDGVENMRLDHQMLEHAASSGSALLRIYQWSVPTLTLGYFQPRLDRQQHSASQSLRCVRRSTGGGAIVHHHDWTYSLALPAEFFASSLGAAQPVYDTVHDCVVACLQEYGFQASKWELPTCKSESCSFLCFERRSNGDIVIGDSKLMGSAQRRFKGALLQHGSLLLAQSEFAPSLKGLEELPRIPRENVACEPPMALPSSGRMPTLKDFCDALLAGMGSHFELEFSLKENGLADLVKDANKGSFGQDSWEGKR